MNSNTHTERFVVFDLQEAHASGVYRPKGQYPMEVSIRLEDAIAMAHAKSSALDTESWAQVRRLTAQAVNARTRTARYTWLLSATDSFGKVVAPMAPCKRGCSQCCYGPKPINDYEAAEMGKALDIPVLSSAQAVKSSRLEAVAKDEPCLFLRNGECSIYEYRPVACRIRYTLDRDDLLCTYNGEFGVPAPLADASIITKPAKNIFRPSSVVADLRHWFSVEGGLTISGRKGAT